MSASQTQIIEELLRQGGSKTTPGRKALLVVLRSSRRPLSVPQILKKIPSLNRVTVYRALDAFVKSGLVRRIDFGHAHAHYELNAGEHHHHVICARCGKIEDTSICMSATMKQNILKKSEHFKSIHDHSLEFFGLCTSCARS